MQEKNEHNKLKQQNMKILEELRNAQSAIEKLNSKNSSMLENYRKLFVEKEHILTELRKLTSSLENVVVLLQFSVIFLPMLVYINDL